MKKKQKPKRYGKLWKTVEKLRKKFGGTAIQKGAALVEKKGEQQN